MKKQNLALMISIGLVLSACGKGKSSLTQAELPGTAATGIDEASDALFEGTQVGTSSGALSLQPQVSGMDLSGLVSAGTFNRTRVCDDSDPRLALVTINTSGALSRSFSGAQVSRQSAATYVGSETRLWTPAASADPIACAANNKWVQIDWSNNAQIAGLQLDVNVNRQRNASLSIVRKGVTSTFTGNLSMTGARKVSFQSAAAGSGTDIVVNKEVTSDVHRTRVITKADGSTESFDAHVLTDPNAPLQIQVTRDGSVGGNFNIKQKNIRSGSLIVERGSGKLVLSFSDVVYDFNVDGHRCVPVSGSIAGSFYADSAATSSTADFKIDFAVDADPVLTFNSGASTYNIDLDDNCDLANMQ